LIVTNERQDQPADSPAPLACSFCHRALDDVRKLIGGHGGAAICDRCVTLFTKMVRAEGAAPEDESDG